MSSEKIFLQQLNQKYYHHLYAKEHSVIFNDLSIYSSYNDIVNKESASGSTLRLGTWLITKQNDQSNLESGVIKEEVPIAMKFLKYDSIFQKHLKETLEQIITNEWRLFVSTGKDFHLLVYLYLKLGFNRINPKCTCKECIHYMGAIQVYEQKIGLNQNQNNNQNNNHQNQNNNNNQKLLLHKLQNNQQYIQFINELLEKKIPKCNYEPINNILHHALLHYFHLNDSYFQNDQNDQNNQNNNPIMIKMLIYLNQNLLFKNEFLNYFEILDEEIHTTARNLTEIEKHCMKTEVLIYLQVIHRLLINFCTPCLLVMYSHEYLDFSQYIVLEQQKYTFYNYLQKYPNKIFDVLNPQFIFMLLYTLACFEEIGFQHNDLHFANYFIEEYNPPIPKLYFMISKNEIILLENIRYIPKIYDYDRSTIFKTKHSTNILSSSFISKALPILYCKLTDENPDSIAKSQTFHCINNVRNKNWDLTVLLIGFIRAAEIHVQKMKRTSQFFTSMNVHEFQNYIKSLHPTMSIITKLLNLLEIYPMPTQYNKQKKKHYYSIAHTMKSTKDAKIYSVYNRCSPYFKKNNLNGLDVTPFSDGEYVNTFCSQSETEHNNHYKRFGYCSYCNLNQNTNPKHLILNPHVTPLGIITNKSLIKNLFCFKILSHLKDHNENIIFKLPHLTNQLI